VVAPDQLWALVRAPFTFVHRTRTKFFVWSHFPSRQVKSLGLKMLVYLVAFSEPPSEITWLENACLFGRIFRVAK
jgi:hypothetical protein